MLFNVVPSQNKVLKFNKYYYIIFNYCKILE